MHKYIDLNKAANYPHTLKNKAYREYITRFMSLLNRIAPNRYELNTWNALASIEDKHTGLTALEFSSNPF